MPSAPSARSADKRASNAVTCAGSAGRCQAGSEMRAMKAFRLGSGGRPATACIRASAQEAAKP